MRIVRDLNEHIYQVAVGLTGELEGSEPPLAATVQWMAILGDPTSRPDIPTLVQLTRNRDLTYLGFLLQLCLCSREARVTFGWGRHRELAMLESIYRHLSAPDEHHVVDPR